MGRQHAVRELVRHSHRRTRSRSTVRKPQRSSRQTVQAALVCQRLLRLLYRHSPLLVVGLWAILIGSAIAAWTSITDPDASISRLAQSSTDPPEPVSPSVASAPAIVDAEPKSDPPPNPPPSATIHPPPQASAVQPSPEALTVPSPPVREQPASPSPVPALWMLAVSCAAGCLLLFQWTKPRRTARLPRSLDAVRSKSLAPASDLPPRSTASRPALNPQVNSTSAAPAPVSFTIQSIQPAIQPTAAQPDPGAEVTEVAVTVVPPDQSHPLDWNEPSLADSLDLRQRRPLSYWL